MKTSVTLSLLLFISTILLLPSCTKEDFSWNRQKISFVQLINDTIPIETTEKILLSADILDIESDTLRPQPDAVTQYGHLYSTDINLLDQLYDNLDQVRANGIIVVQGGSLIVEAGNPPGTKTYSSQIEATKLDPQARYHYAAFVLRPSNEALIISDVSPRKFKVPKVKVDTDLPKDSIIANEMKVRVIHKIEEAENIIIVEQGIRLLTNDCKEVVDSCFVLDNSGTLFSGSQSSIFEVPFFEVDQIYCVQAYLKYQEQQGGPVFIEYDNQFESFLYDGKGIWVNTNKIRKKSHPNVSVDPPPMEHAVSFVLPGGDGLNYAYIGLGRAGNNGPYNRSFWQFDPRSYTWTELTDYALPQAPEREQTVFFTRIENGRPFAYVGMGLRANGQDTSFYTSFFKTDFIDPWAEVILDVDLREQLTQTSLAEGITALGSNVTLANSVKNQLYGRRAPFSASNSTQAFWGGGIAKRLVVNNIAQRSCTDNQRCKDIYDFNGNESINTGQWVDLNGDGVVNAGTTVFNNNEAVGINLDSDDDIEITNTNAAGDFTISTGSGTKVIRSLSTNQDAELASDSYGLNPTVQQSEWLDTNFNDTIDLDEINLEYYTAADLWLLGTESWGRKRDGAYQRYGATAFSIANVSYLLGGAVNEDTYAASHSLDADGENLQHLQSLPTIQTLFGVDFKLGETVFFGGGEDTAGNLRGLNFVSFQDEKIDNIIGCGLSTLSKGVAFAVNGKGFIGIGKVDSDIWVSEIWMYIPQ